MIITHIKRDSDCNGNEKDNSEKQLGGGGGGGSKQKLNKIIDKTFWVIYRERGE